jgi:hypothetical protein
MSLSGIKGVTIGTMGDLERRALLIIFSAEVTFPDLPPLIPLVNPTDHPLE